MGREFVICDDCHYMNDDNNYNDDDNHNDIVDTTNI